MRKKTQSHRSIAGGFVVAMFVYWAHAWTPNKQLARYRRPPSTPGFFWQRPLLKLFSKSSSFLEEEKKAATTIINDTPLHHHGLLSPYHILNPVSFTELPSLAERSLPLEACIRLLRRTLQAIINSHPLQLNQIQSKVIRIEHTISHAVDPLCWLQAQTQQDNGHPSLYFASAEGTLETAVYGSSWLESRPAKDNKDYWKLVENLPPDCYVYGAERFDSKSNISDEWKNFGQAFWVLPAVEIRKKDNKTIIAIHLLNDEDHSFTQSARRVLEIMAYVSDKAVPSIPPTTLPPVLFRASTYGPGLDGQEIYERGVTEALEKFQSSTLKKVVLARRMDLTFDRHASRNVHALDILRKWKFATQPGGHMFYINPGGSGGEFFGCTPERLFQVHSNEILSEAVAGTRPRGSNQQADEELARQLFLSPKDKDENVITGNFILSVFRDMEERGYVDLSKGNNTTLGNHFSVRRLRHLQHICQRFQCTLSASAGGQRDAGATDAIQYLLTSLHPTPAVGGFPKKEAMDFIRNHETTGFDRGFYSGPVGFVGKDSAEIVVGIRSGLVTRHEQKSKVSVYAGAGIVPLSSVQAEFVETSYKLAVVSSVFPQSPITLQSAQNSNAAWATAFIEELIRNGVTQFYICPGSRSTPLVAAIAKAVRSNVGVVHAMSIHDERGAGFRALGYGRGRGRPAAVVTSSGTATSNLYPSVVEAGMDGVPLLVLTADRPYESRDTGANQAIDQVKLFSSTYIRWFRDVLPPNDNVPVSVALADAAHGVSMSRELRGPVHLNIQFRENLAPDGGPIRNDDRVGSTTMYDGLRFTDTPGFQRWSLGGEQWIKSSSFASYANTIEATGADAMEIAHLIRQSKRGIIVVGNLRKPTNGSEDVSQTIKQLSSFAQSIGFPILAGVQSGSLRFASPAVVPFAEHLLKCPIIQENLNPDLVLQFGAPLVSTEIPTLITGRMSEAPLHHVIVHPHQPNERADPEFSVTHKVNADIGFFVKALMRYLEESSTGVSRQSSSELAPLVCLGRMLQSKMSSIVDHTAEHLKEMDPDFQELIEPQVVMTLSKMISANDAPELSLFLSNSMPVRDAEAFLYPLLSQEDHDVVGNEASTNNPALLDTGVNRGASGIDGIIASAAGFADSTDRPTTLLIGDVAALYDINSLHALRTGMSPKEAQARKTHPLTTIVLNNDGGGIFSFLPIAKHGNDVAFDEFFGTPTNTFSFEKGAAAFGLSFERVKTASSFKKSYSSAVSSVESSLIEVAVASREKNVIAHKEITRRTNDLLSTFLKDDGYLSPEIEILPMKRFARGSIEPIMEQVSSADFSKTLVVLHGWMGSKSEWDDVSTSLDQSLPPEWSILSIDLPGHGESRLRHSSDLQSTRDMLGLNKSDGEKPNSFSSDLSVDQMASSVLLTLEEHGIDSVDVIAGYSLGGRVALALKRMCMLSPNLIGSKIVGEGTKTILISAYPGEFPGASSSGSGIQDANTQRLLRDDALSREMMDLSNRAYLVAHTLEEESLLWSDFLHNWYSASVWGNLQKSSSKSYVKMIKKRTESLSTRGKDFASALAQCSPPRHRRDDWRALIAEDTLVIAGSMDEKYSSIGRDWSSASPGLNYHEIPKKGHALLVEAPEEVATIMEEFICSTKKEEMEPYSEEGSLVLSYPKKDERTSEGVVAESYSYTEPMTAKDECGFDPLFRESIGSLDFERFVIDIRDERTKKTGLIGTGWGEKAKARKSNSLSQRAGFIIQILSKDGSRGGIGEVSPFSGLHPESLTDAEQQLNVIASKISEFECGEIPSFDPTTILAMNGGMEEYIFSLTRAVGIKKLLPSIRSGIEMALLSLASEVVRVPIHQALLEYCPKEVEVSMAGSMLPLNGLITRGIRPAGLPRGNDQYMKFESWKVKVGHQKPEVDAMALSYAFQLSNQQTDKQVRADANRGFNYTTAIDFAKALEEIDFNIVKSLDYVEEPLEKKKADVVGETWSVGKQVEELERWHEQTSIPYALDESISDLAEMHAGDYDSMIEDLRAVFYTRRGCAAFVLKPSLLGLELSMRLARTAKQELGIGAVFTSSFDSGVGLSYAAFLASLADATKQKQNYASENLATAAASRNPELAEEKRYSHGLSTFSLMSQDCLSPSFGSYVNQNGLLNVASLSRAFYGLGLDEIQSLCIAPLQTPELPDVVASSRSAGDAMGENISSLASDEFEASTATSSSGREIVVVASLPLQFSADVACARFTDLPQQPRWSPWISSVAYLDAGSETEWRLRVRGVNFRWRATSSLLDDPYKGIQWESVSGLKNTGVVEFISTGEASSLMKVRMVIVTPRILSSLFSGTSVFFEDFLRNKVLKWSLEMFRDVVKGDLALEEGNIELGDALFGAAEGKANAIEATLSPPMDN